MSLESILEEKKGQILKKSQNIFEKSDFLCCHGHQFSAFSNDIITNNFWCTECQNETSKITQILNTLNIKFSERKLIGSYIYDYAINQGRNFVIFYGQNNYQDKVNDAHKQNYNAIVIFKEEENMQEQIWNSIKENKKLTLLGKEEVEKYEHTCEIEKVLSSDKDDGGSVIKLAPKPYPINVNKAVGYIRVSTAMQVNDGFSLDAQESKICSEAKKRNLFLKALYIDKGISGGSMEKRLSLEELRKQVEENTWIIINSVSRLARNTKDLLSLVDEIEAKKSHLIIIDLNLDITSPSGKLILTLMASQAQFERELTSERVKGVLQHLKKTGNLRTKPAFGWSVNYDRSPDAPLHIRNEEEQEIIKKVRLLRNVYPDLGITAFTNRLNKSKIPPPRKSKLWYHKNVKLLMDREGIK